MRTYKDLDGQVTGTSQGCTGGCAQIVLALIAVFLLLVVFAAAGHAATPAAPNPGCGPSHRVSGEYSLRRVAAVHDNADVAYLLTATLVCNGGKRYPAYLQAYLDQGSLEVPMYAGTRVWFTAPGIGQPAAITTRQQVTHAHSALITYKTKVGPALTGFKCAHAPTWSNGGYTAHYGVGDPCTRL